MRPNGDGIALGSIETPIGSMIAGATARGLCFLEFTDRRGLKAQMDGLADLFRLPVTRGENEAIERTRDEIGRYFAGTLKRFSIPLEYPGTDFQVAVWNALLEIPYGETRSYEDVARSLGAPKAVRAVGHANGLNRIGIVIPCHRVLNKSGELGGYGGGLWRKKRLLELEGALPPSFSSA